MPSTISSLRRGHHHHRVHTNTALRYLHIDGSRGPGHNETQRLPYECISYNTNLTDACTAFSKCTPPRHCIGLPSNLKQSERQGLVYVVRIYSVRSGISLVIRSTCRTITSHTSTAHLCRHSCTVYISQQWLIVFDGSSWTTKDGSSGRELIGPC